MIAPLDSNAEGSLGQNDFAGVRFPAVAECACPNERKAEGHLPPREAGEIASLARVKRLVLTHFYPECEGADILGQGRETYAGEIILAEDLLRVRV